MKESSIIGGAFIPNHGFANQIFVRDKGEQFGKVHTKCSSSPKTSMEDIADISLANRLHFVELQAPLLGLGPLSTTMSFNIS